MTAEELRRSAGRDAAPPEGLPAPLAALWWAARGDWERAHALVRAGGDADSAWVHTHLHRQEGDLANADHWYGRAGRRRPAEPLGAEWLAIAEALLGRRGA